MSFDEEDLLEKLYDICHLFKYLVKKRLLIFVNINSYLTNEEFKNLINYIQLNQIDCLILEHFQVAGFKQFILDEDYFLIEQNML